MNRIAILGPAFTFHDLASQTFLPDHQAVYYDKFDLIFQDLIEGKIHEALIAVHNSEAGWVENNWERIQKEGLKLKAEFELRIALHLAGKAKYQLKDIKRIYSHPMALAQTKKYFIPDQGIEFISTSSTAAAIEQLKKEKSVNAGVICSKEAIKSNELYMIEQNIQDSTKNMTRFAWVSRSC